MLEVHTQTSCQTSRKPFASVSKLQAWADLEKILGGGQPNIVGIKVAQLNVLLELQLRTSLMISQIPV